jgi:hypothetical protein
MLKKILFVFIIFSINVFGQYVNKVEPPSVNLKNINIFQKPGCINFSIIRSDGKIETGNIDLTEEINIIVEFKGDPLFLKQKSAKFAKISAESYKNQLSVFYNDFERIRKSLSSKMGISIKSPQIKESYYRLFNGVSMRVQRAMIPGIESLDYVEKIHEDFKVKADLGESIPLIKADAVWSQFGNKGDSMVVAIIDCGINYNHPALGGGFGKGYKVIGGYDFVNDDNDPMDDNGHGTHVAGIVAGNSAKIQGVAPNALLLAYKVLDASGSGWASKIISAIEQSMDPYNDGNEKCKVDVINLSLGGSGDPDDALSRTVDNAVECGIVVCVAAGNSGEKGFRSIESPGSARRAITVGASDKKDALAYFSSKGPNTMIYSIKPDVLAPGASILSSSLNGGYELNSGTSMAAPHVAGVCALLKKMHPDWSPDYIKSALMITSKDIGSEVMAQGAGRIDALIAIKTSTLVIPASINLGLDDLNKNIWNTEENLLIKNISNIKKQYNIESGSTANGISITAEPQNFSLLPGDSIRINIKFRVDNKLAVFNYDSTTYNYKRSLTFSGNIKIKEDQDIFHIPWAFVKSPRILFKANKASRFIVTNDQGVYSSGDEPVTKKELLVEPGVYDIYAFTHSDYSLMGELNMVVSFKEKVTLKNNDTLTFKTTDAKNIVKYHFKDYDGIDLEKKSHIWMNNFLLKCTNYSIHIGGFGSANLSLTQIPENTYLYLSGYYADTLSNIIRMANSSVINGLKNSIELTNDYGKYNEQKYVMNIPDNIDQPGLKFNPSYYMLLGKDGYLVATTRLANLSVNKNPITVYSMPNENQWLISETHSLSILSRDNFVSEYNPFFIENDSIYNSLFPIPTKDLYRVKRGKEFTINCGLIYPNNYFGNNWLVDGSILSWNGFYGLLNEERNYDREFTKVRVYDKNNNLVIQDNESEIASTALQVPKGKYRMEMDNENYYFMNVKGTAKCATEFDISLKDPNPPYIKSMQIRNSKGIPVEKLIKGEIATLYIAVQDQSYYSYPKRGVMINPVSDDSTKIFIKRYGSKVWKKLDFKQISADTIIGSYYYADLSEYTNQNNVTGLDLKMVFYDKSGNNVEYTVEPAVAVGNIINIGKEDDTLSNPVKNFESYALYNNYPNPFNPSTTIRYFLPERANLKIEIYNVLGQKVETLVDGVQELGYHEIEWNAKNYSSGVYFCRMIASGKRSYEKIQKLILAK